MWFRGKSYIKLPLPKALFTLLGTYVTLCSGVLRMGTSLPRRRSFGSSRNLFSSTVRDIEERLRDEQIEGVREGD